MKFKLSRFAAIAALSCSIFVGRQASAGFAVDLSDFNLVVLGDLQSSSEVEGRTLIGGTLSGNSSNYGTRLNTSTLVDALIVGGDINGGPKNVYGDVSVGGNVNTIINLNAGGSVRSESFSIDDVRKTLLDSSSSFSALATNSSVSLPGSQPSAVKFNASPTNGTAVFNVAASDLFSNKTQQIELNAGGADQIIINVSGTDVFWQTGNIVGDLTSKDLRDRVVWNFYEAVNITLYNSLYGTLLAPNAHFQNGTAIEGNVYVNSMTQNGEVHLGSTDFPPPTGVPSPTAAIAGVALISLLASRRPRRA